MNREARNFFFEKQSEEISKLKDASLGFFILAREIEAFFTDISTNFSKAELMLSPKGNVPNLQIQF